MQAATNGGSDYDPVDYRCYTKNEPNEAEFNNCNGRQPEEDEESRKYRRGSLIFRPESAPTVLDMSPDNSMSGPPSVRNMDMCDSHRDDDHEDDLSDCVSKAFSITPDAMGRYSCDECGKIFKHPGSLQHHRHIHRGTHRCPSCGKAFSRRWDMERHLNKSKYGCPANRFSTGSNGSSSTSSQSGERTVSSATVPPSSLQSAAHLQLLSAAAVTANGIHNTTA